MAKSLRTFYKAMDCHIAYGGIVEQSICVTENRCERKIRDFCRLREAVACFHF